jgi:hypothetical protein
MRCNLQVLDHHDNSLPNFPLDLSLDRNISNYEDIKINEIGTENGTNSLKANVPFKIMIHGFLAHCDKRIFPRSLIQGVCIFLYY